MKNKKLISCCIGAVFFILLYLLNMIYFSIKPDFFQVKGDAQSPVGVLFSETVAKLIENELNSSGGWIPNDIPLFPTWFLDNRPNFQLGVLEVTRYSTRVLRDNLSRQRTTDKIDIDCNGAFTSFSNDPFKWLIPSAESKYRKGVEEIRKYEQRLKNGDASLYPRSDNLIQLLEQYASLLGGVNTRLLNASRENDTLSAVGPAGGQHEKNRLMLTSVPWTKIDDNFYYAQGVGYALYHMFKAIKTDFAAVIKDKNAEIIIGEIIASLKESSFEPLIVTNGSKEGIFANHSNNLRVFLDDARQKTSSLMRMLDQG